MAQHRLRIGAPVAPYPTWRQSIVSTNTLYSFGNTPSTLLAQMVWPGGSPITNMDGGSDGTPEMQHRGWGSAWYAPDRGAHGSFVFGRTGEFTMENQLSELPISQDSPAWQWFRQPVAMLTETSAATADADYYYNPTDYATLPATNVVNSASWASWPKTFPVGLPASVQSGWIVRRKVKNHSFGNAIMARHRYDAHTCISSSWTGTGAGALVINPQTLGGPFQGWTSQPSGIAKSDWFDTVGSSGEARMRLSFTNTSTGTSSFSSILTPDSSQLLGTPAGPCFKDEGNKRLLWISNAPSGWGYWYADFSLGIAGVTASGHISMTANGTPTDFSPSDAATGGFTEGHSTNRRIGYWMAGNNSTPHLWCFDFDTNEYKYLDLTGKGLSWATPGGKPRLAMTYRVYDNTMLMIEHTRSADTGTPQIWLHKFTVPSNPFDTSLYSITKTQLTASGGAIIDEPEWMFGDRCVLIASLGNVIVLPQKTNKPLAFIPS